MYYIWCTYVRCSQCNFLTEREEENGSVVGMLRIFKKNAFTMQQVWRTQELSEGTDLRGEWGSGTTELREEVDCKDLKRCSQPLKNKHNFWEIITRFRFISLNLISTKTMKKNVKLWNKKIIQDRCLAIWLPLYLSIYLFIYLSLYLSKHLSIYLFIYLSIYLSIYLLCRVYFFTGKLFPRPN